MSGGSERPKGGGGSERPKGGEGGSERPKGGSGDTTIGDKGGDICWNVTLKEGVLDIDLLVGGVWNRYAFRMEMTKFIIATFDTKFAWMRTVRGLISTARRFPRRAIERTGHMKFVRIRGGGARRPPGLKFMPIVNAPARGCFISLDPTGLVRVAGIGYGATLPVTPDEFERFITAPGIAWVLQCDGSWMTKSTGAMFLRLAARSILFRMEEPKK